MGNEAVIMSDSTSVYWLSEVHTYVRMYRLIYFIRFVSNCSMHVRTYVDRCTITLSKGTRECKHTYVHMNGTPHRKDN